MYYNCPVCGFGGLEFKPYAVWPPPPDLKLSPPYADLLGQASYGICPSCSFEFGLDDDPGDSKPDSFESYFEDWVARGRPLFNAKKVEAWNERYGR